MGDKKKGRKKSTEKEIKAQIRRMLPRQPSLRQRYRVIKFNSPTRRARLIARLVYLSKYSSAVSHPHFIAVTCFFGRALSPCPCTFDVACHVCTRVGIHAGHWTT